MPWRDLLCEHHSDTAQVFLVELKGEHADVLLKVENPKKILYNWKKRPRETSYLGQYALYSSWTYSTRQIKAVGVFLPFAFSPFFPSLVVQNQHELKKWLKKNL